MISLARSFAGAGALIALLAVSGCHTPRSNVPPGLGFGKNRAGLMKNNDNMSLNPYGPNGSMGMPGMGANPSSPQQFGSQTPVNGGVVQYGKTDVPNPLDPTIQMPPTATGTSSTAPGSGSYSLPSGTSVTNMPATGGYGAGTPGQIP